MRANRTTAAGSNFLLMQLILDTPSSHPLPLAPSIFIDGGCGVGIGLALLLLIIKAINNVILWLHNQATVDSRCCFNRFWSVLPVLCLFSSNEEDGRDWPPIRCLPRHSPAESCPDLGLMECQFLFDVVVA